MSTDTPRPDQPRKAEGEAPEGVTEPSVTEPPPAPEPPPVAEPPPALAPAPGGVYPTGTYPPGTYPPGVYPAGTTVDGEPVAPIAVAAAPKKRGGLIAAVAAGVVVIGGLVLKFGLPILIGSAAAGLLDGVFGGPFERLPDDQQKAFEQRVEAALGDSVKDLSDAEVTAKIDTMLSAGLPRLGDQVLVDKIHLDVLILNAADIPTCARLARANADGSADREAMSLALGAIDTVSLGRWFDMNISAIEAEAAGAPPARTTDDDEVTRIFTDVAAMFTETQAEHVGTLYNGGEVSDPDACDAIRAVYGTIERLPPADLAIAALYDVSP